MGENRSMGPERRALLCEGMDKGEAMSNARAGLRHSPSYLSQRPSGFPEGSGQELAPASTNGGPVAVASQGPSLSHSG